MIELTIEQRQELEGGGLTRVRDPRTDRIYVLVSEEMYARMQGLLGEDFSPRDAYRAIDAAFRTDWDNPAMAEYDHYEEHRP